MAGSGRGIASAPSSEEADDRINDSVERAGRHTGVKGQRQDFLTDLIRYRKIPSPTMREAREPVAGLPVYSGIDSFLRQ